MDCLLSSQSSTYYASTLLFSVICCLKYCAVYLPVADTWFIIQRSFHSAYCYVSTTPLIVACCKLRVRPVQHLYGNALCHLYGLYLPYLIYSLIAVQCCTFFTLHQASPPRFVDIACCFSPLLFIVLNDCYYNATCKRYVLQFPPLQFVVVDHDH